MWILMDTGFISFVRHNKDESLMLVRARVKEDLEAFSDLHEQEYGTPLTVLRDDKADYRWRATCDRAHVAVVIAKKIMDYDATSHVKDVAIERSAPNAARRDAYYATWAAMEEMQWAEDGPDPDLLLPSQKNSHWWSKPNSRDRMYFDD